MLPALFPNRVAEKRAQRSEVWQTQKENKICHQASMSFNITDMEGNLCIVEWCQGTYSAQDVLVSL